MTFYYLNSGIHGNKKANTLIYCLKLTLLLKNNIENVTKSKSNFSMAIVIPYITIKPFSAVLK